MTNRLLFFGMILFVLSFVAHAQKTTTAPVTVKGILLDSLTNESEPYATIRISKKTLPDKPVKLAVTGIDGKFQEKLSEQGDYVMTISSIGKSTVKREFSIAPDSKVIDFGTLFTSEASELMEGIEVIAQKPLVKVDMDKIEYNIEDDPDSKSSNVLDMLRKVPLVTVDGEDKVQVNGSSSFKIHVNGKPNNMMSNNPTEVLKSMPANTIKYIEVITEPGAKYDAEGVGGILNIVTVGGGMEGYTATFNGNVGNRGAGAGAYATVQAGKFTVTGNYSYNYYKSPDSSSEDFRESYVSDENKYLSTRIENDYKGNYQYGNIEGSYEIDTLRLISFSANLYGGSGKGNGDGTTNMLDINNEHTYSYNAHGWNKSSNQYVGASLDYQRTFKKKGELFTLSYRLNNSPNESENRVDYSDKRDYPYSLKNMYGENDAKTIEHTFQADYTNPLTKMHEIEAGVKYIIRNSRSDSRYYDVENDGTKTEDLAKSNEYDHLQDILAAYGGYRLRVKKFGLKAGLRYEHTFMKVENHMRDNSDFNANFDNLVPSATLSYKVGEAQTVRASYNMRISRPGIWYLNPFVNRTKPDDISYGNRDLDSEKSHAFSAKFSSFTQKFNIDLTLRYSFVNNSIERYSFIGPDEETGRENVQHNTYQNMGKSRNTRLSTYMNWNIGPKTRLYMNGGVSYVDFKSEEQGIANSGFNYNCYGGFQHTLPWALRLSINGGGSSARTSTQGKRSGYYYYSLGLNRQFLKERLTLSVNTSNPFEKYRDFKNTINDETFYSFSKSRNPARYFGFSVSYRIGELKASVKKAARSIDNDDTKGNDNGNGSSGQN